MSKKTVRFRGFADVQRGHRASWPMSVLRLTQLENRAQLAELADNILNALARLHAIESAFVFAAD